MRSRCYLVFVAGVLGLCLLDLEASAAVRPFLTLGGQTTRTEKTDLDEMLDEFTVRDNTESWEVGGGLRIFSSERGRIGDSDAPIEVRLRFALGGGSLPDVRVTGWRSDYSYRNRFQVSYHESLDYRSWILGGLFSARVLPRGGFYLGPVLQSVRYEAERGWSGPTDCWQCGPGKDKSTIRYGQIEVGGHYRPLPWPLRVEGYWTPVRVELSTTHIVQSDNYQANFGTFDRSFGLRLGYEF